MHFARATARDYVRCLPSPSRLVHGRQRTSQSSGGFHSQPLPSAPVEASTRPRNQPPRAKLRGITASPSTVSKTVSGGFSSDEGSDPSPSVLEPESGVLMGSSAPPSLVRAPPLLPLDGAGGALQTGVECHRTVTWRAVDGVAPPSTFYIIAQPTAVSSGACRSASPTLGVVGCRDAQLAGVSFRAQHTWAVRPERRWVPDSASHGLSHAASPSCG